MAEKILMIALSPTMEEGNVVKWHKKLGDHVQSGDVLCEVETDKAAMDYESTTEGTLLKILIHEGQKASVGDVIAVVGEEGEDIGQLMTAIEKSLSNTKANKDDTSGGVAIENKTSEQSEKPDAQESDQDSPNEGERRKASPLAKKLAEQHGLDLNTMMGSGPQGRVIKADIEAALSQTGRATDREGKKSSPVVSESIPVSGKRKVIAQRLSESMFSAPHYYLKTAVGVDSLIDARKLVNATGNRKVSFNAFLIKFVAEALRRHPMINASWSGETITLFKQVDVGLAVAQSDGLITPVVRDCVNKGILQIEEELKELIVKAQNNTLKQDEYQGATFTISNLGSFGIDEFTAIINPPGSAILAVGEIKRKPIVDEKDEIIIQSQMKLTLSCDHRVIDGAVGAAFLKTLKESIENPIHALL